MLIDGTIGAFDTTQQQLVSFPFIQEHQAILKFDDAFIEKMGEVYASCGYKSIVDTYLKFPPPGHQPPSRSKGYGCDIFTQARMKWMRTNPCNDIYQIDHVCPQRVSPMK